MRCEEVLELIGAYLDSELDVKSNVEVEEHLSHCPECQKVYKSQHQFERNIKEYLKTDPSIEKSWQRALNSLEHEISPRRFVFRMAAAIVALFLVVFFGWHQYNSANYDLSRFAIKSHEKYIAHQLPLMIHSSSAEEVENYFKGKLSFDLKIPRNLPLKDARLAGARMCHLNKVPVAYLVYYVDNKPVSVFIMHGSEAVQFRQIRHKNLHAPENLPAGQAGMQYHKFGDRLVMI